MKALFATLLLSAGLFLTPAITSADFDLASLNTQVQNHEARITAVEHAQATPVAPSPAPPHSPAPVPQSAPQAPVATPAAPTLVSSNYRCVTAANGSHTSYRDDTYSDGSVTTTFVGNLCLSN